ncbi:uncharacterized protein LOC120167833 [Hibiscus syriacus]|uniref:uncharacterized protein LOC120167833 n=1 Tax=Hibiscus syriacus TaxID=106335 RepID=UPI0019213747|nr:uncharacterized protein LOC120167833 [Hibiscus syriacus]
MLLRRNGHNWRQPFPSLPTSAPCSSSSNSTPAKPKQFSVRSAPSPPKRRESRRPVSISLFLSHFLLAPKYKHLTIPETTLEVDDKPEYATCRSPLSSGPDASLRVNIRAVAQHASDAGNGENAFKDVDQCLRVLEELDSLLLHASRNKPDASVKAMKAKIGTALNALDSLLKTVPSHVLNQAEEIDDAHGAPDEDNSQLPRELDPEMKQLESIL